MSTRRSSSTTARLALTRPCDTCSSWARATRSRIGRGNKVGYRPVQLGPIFDGLREVQSGLARGETIVVNGLQRVRPGAQVQPQRVAMGEKRPGEGVTLLARNASGA